MNKKHILNWEKVVDQGFKNNNNICAWSMKKYDKHIYIGTLNFKDGCQLFRSSTGDKSTWQQVNINGFDEKYPSTGIRTLIEYKKLLWAVTLSSEHGTQVWVTNGKVDKKNKILFWKKVNLNGFGLGTEIHGSRAMTIFNDRLYIGTQCKKGIPRIYRYDGNTDFNKLQPEKWTWINKEWNENTKKIPDFSVIGKLTNYKEKNGKEYIYTSIYSEVVPIINRLKKKFRLKELFKILFFFFTPNCQILRYDGKKWETISKKGFGKTNILAMSSIVFDNNVYFGTSNLFGAELWKSNKGLNWKRVIKRGFNVPFNISIWRMHIYKDRLVIGMQNQFLGCQIWASKNKKFKNKNDFIQIAPTGMKNKIQINPLKIKQDGIRTFETFNNNLYIGTASDMNIIFYNKKGPGCEIWRTKDNIIL